MLIRITILALSLFRKEYEINVLRKSVFSAVDSVIICRLVGSGRRIREVSGEESRGGCPCFFCFS